MLTKVKGSSPRMRGAQGPAGPAATVDGIIPAYAGSTWHTAYIPKPPEDHPRVCGEHYVSYHLVHVYSGSSPRMRGARHPAFRAQDRGGIIPAYAGSTQAPRPYWHLRKDHPRVCGEHSGSPPLLASAQGSSPRMRGART